MVFSPRPRRRRIGRGGRDGVAIAAAGLVRPWSAAIFAAAAVPGSVAEDLAVTIPPELEVQFCGAARGVTAPLADHISRPLSTQAQF